MSHFAEINKEGIVLRVIVAEQDFIDSGLVGDPKNWIQTSYNTIGGVNKKGGSPLRKNFAGVDYTYDKDRDAFLAPQPYQSWILDEKSCLWNAPIPYPLDNKNYEWDEKTLSWKEIILQK